MRKRTLAAIGGAWACTVIAAGASAAWVSGSSSPEKAPDRCEKVFADGEELLKALDEARKANRERYMTMRSWPVQLDHRIALLVTNDPACFPPGLVVRAQQTVADNARGVVTFFAPAPTPTPIAVPCAYSIQTDCAP